MLVAARRDLELFTAFLEREPDQPAGWRQAVTVHTRTAVMSPASCGNGARGRGRSREHVQRARQELQAGARPVRLAIRGFPQGLTARAPGNG